MSDEEIIRAIMQNRNMATRAEVLAFDDALAKVPENASEVLLRGLLRALFDDARFPEVMMGIVHTVEYAPKDRYLSALIGMAPEMEPAARGWRNTLLCRALNSPETILPLTDAIAVSDPASRKILIEDLNEIVKMEAGKLAESARLVLRRLVPVT